MIKILENAFIDFFKDAFPVIDLIFSQLIKIVFFVEDNLSDGSIFQNNIFDNSKSELFFGNIFDITLKVGVSLCTLKIVKKIFDTYILNIDGDSGVSVERMLLGYIKALIIMFSFTYLYKIFADISIEFTNEILDAVGLSVFPSLMDILANFMTRGIFMIVGLLIFFGLYICLIYQFIKRGLEMFILRLGVPLAVTGLIDSDNGVFAPYIKVFIQNSLTVVIQLSLLKLGLGVLANGNIFFGIGAMGMSLKTPQFLQQFMIGIGGSNINMMQINSSLSMVRSLSKIIKK